MGTFPWGRDKYVQMLRMLLVTGEFDEKNVKIITYDTVIFNGFLDYRASRSGGETIISCREWWLRENPEFCDVFEFTDDETDLIQVDSDSGDESADNQEEELEDGDESADNQEEELEDGDSGGELEEATGEAADRLMNDVFESIEPRHSIAKLREDECVDRILNPEPESTPHCVLTKVCANNEAPSWRYKSLMYWKPNGDCVRLGDTYLEPNPKTVNTKLYLWGKNRNVVVVEDGTAGRLWTQTSARCPRYLPDCCRANFKSPHLRKLRQNCPLGMEWDYLVGESFYIAFMAKMFDTSDTTTTIVHHHVGFIRGVGELPGGHVLLNPDAIERTAALDFTNSEWFLKDKSGGPNRSGEVYEFVKEVDYANPIELGGRTAQCGSGEQKSLYWVTDKKWAPLFERIPSGGPSELLRLTGWLQR